MNTCHGYLITFSLPALAAPLLLVLPTLSTTPWRVVAGVDARGGLPGKVFWEADG